MDPLQKALAALDSGDGAALNDAEHALGLLLPTCVTVERSADGGLVVDASDLLCWAATRDRVQTGAAWLDLLERVLVESPEYRAMVGARIRLALAQDAAEVMLRVIVAAAPYTAPRATRLEHFELLIVVKERTDELQQAVDALAAAARRLARLVATPRPVKSGGDA